MSQYHLSSIGRTWDDILSENGFGKTQYCPSPLPKVRQKTRKSSLPESSNKLDPESNHKEVEINNPILGNDSKGDIEGDDSIPVCEIPIDLSP